MKRRNFLGQALASIGALSVLPAAARALVESELKPHTPLPPEPSPLPFSLEGPSFHVVHAFNPHDEVAISYEAEEGCTVSISVDGGQRYDTGKRKGLIIVERPRFGDSDSICSLRAIKRGQSIIHSILVPRIGA